MNEQTRRGGTAAGAAALPGPMYAVPDAEGPARVPVPRGGRTAGADGGTRQPGAAAGADGGRLPGGAARGAVRPIAVHSADPLVRAGLAALLGRLPEFALVPDGHGDIDVVVVDDAVADLVGTLRELGVRHPRARFVVLAGERLPADLFGAVGSGLAAVVPRAEVDAERLRETLAAVGRGGGDLPPQLQGRLHEQIRRVQQQVLGPRGLTAQGLDRRELDVLRLLATGLAVREIGERLSYSERTVKNILHALMSRLELRNRTHAVAFAIRCGLI